LPWTLLKLIGSSLIVYACGSVGLMVAGSYARRPRELANVASALVNLQTEISYAATPLPEALAGLARQAGEPAGRLFAETARALRHNRGTTAGEAWAAALAEVYPDTALRDVDREILEAFGQYLGQSDRLDQERHILAAIERLRREEARAREDQARNEKLWRYIGFLTGLAVAILTL